MTIEYIWETFSGDSVKLIKSKGSLCVEKNYKNLIRQKKQLAQLLKLGALNLNLPKIKSISPKKIIFEYIRGRTLDEYLLFYSPSDIKLLSKLLFDELKILWGSNVSQSVLSQESIFNRLRKIENNPYLNITSKRKLRKLSKLITGTKLLICDSYHGDLALDNIIINEEGKFYFIDPLPLEFGGPSADISKIFLDLYTEWGERKITVKKTEFYMNKKLLAELIFKKYQENYNIYGIEKDPKNFIILSLLRVAQYIMNNKSSKIIDNILNSYEI